MPKSFVSVNRNSSVPSLSATGLSRPLMRHMLLANGIGVGSRVLVVDDRGTTTAFLRSLGIETVGLALTEPGGLKADPSSGASELHEVSATEAVHLPDHHFDLALVRRPIPFRADRETSAVRFATAHLLAGLRPSGVFVMLAPFDPQIPGKDEHAIRSELVGRLSCFPGLRQTQRWLDGPHRTATWKRWLKGQPRAGFLTVSLQIPPEPVRRAEWLARARREAADEARAQEPVRRRSAA